MAAYDRLGKPIPTPPYVDPQVWVRFCGHVVVIPDGCHFWVGRPRDDGYGQFWAPASAIQTANTDFLITDAQLGLVPEKPRVWRAHRFAWSALHGTSLEETMHLMHQCDEPLCVSVTVEHSHEHLTAGDNFTNVSDREKKGRGVRRGRYGLPVWSKADKRGQAARSLALHKALVAGIEHGLSRADLADRIAEVSAEGTISQQMTLEIPSES